MLRMLAIGMAMMAPAVAAAEPVMLKCTLDNQGTAQPVDVQLNETEGTGSWYWVNTKRSAKSAARFTPANVTFGPFTIDRRTLAIVRENDSIMVRDGAIPATTSGTCAIDKTERAF